MSEGLSVRVGAGAGRKGKGGVPCGVMLIGCNVVIQVVLMLIPLLLEVVEDVVVRALVVGVLVEGGVRWLSVGVERSANEIRISDSDVGGEPIKASGSVGNGVSMWAGRVEEYESYLKSWYPNGVEEYLIGAIERVACVSCGLVVPQGNAFRSLNPEGMGAFDDKGAEGGAWGGLVCSNPVGFDPVSEMFIISVGVRGGVVSGVFEVDPDRVSRSDPATL
eukprot:3058196-Heterocapsa_arctica.AAC.1